jgi:hypothetical protein
MHVAVTIEANNDPSGNPRRGWIVREVREGEKYAYSAAVFVPSEYGGSSNLGEAFPGGVVVIATVQVTTREYLNRCRTSDGYTYAWKRGPVVFAADGTVEVPA